MTRIIFMMIIAGTLTVIGCSSDNTNNNADSTEGVMPDTSSSGLGADTTSAASDSLKDSLNQ